MQPLPKIPGYELLARLGGGVMTSVYSARDLETDTACAVKLVRDDWDDRTPTGPAWVNAKSGAEANKVMGGTVTVGPTDVEFPLDPAGEANRVKVTVHRTVDTLIAKYFGIATADIAAGIDVAIGPAERLGAHAHGVSVRINQRVLDPGGSQWLAAGSDALRIGSSALLSCAPTGGLTGGTIFVASQRGPQLAVRLTGSTGRARVLRFEPGRSTWLP